LEDIVDFFGGESGLSEASKKALATLAKAVHIRVLVVHTWPYCPMAASTSFITCTLRSRIFLKS